MALRDRLENNGTPLSAFNGGTGPQPDFQSSKLHYNYSINGNPFVATTPFKAPSQLDIQGAMPSTAYQNNTPEGQTF